MALYVYVKTKQKRNLKTSLISLLLTLSGLTLLIWVIYPIVSFELILAPKFGKMIKPIPEEVVAQAFENIPTVLGKTYEVDYTKVRNWFPQKPPEPVNVGDNKAYTLSIPKLGIDNAQVIIGGENLAKSLIHYGGTGLPGDYGKAVIFGHSVLPQFFNPKNYKTIFSTLPILDEGDEIFIDYQGIKYRYVVIEMRIVSPDDISALEQRYDHSYISLITCVPPGTYWKRLIVLARLEKPS